MKLYVVQGYRGMLYTAVSLLLLMLGAMIIGCRKSSGNGIPITMGCALGYDVQGIATISLRDKTKTYLLRSDGDHYWTTPVWSKSMRLLLCVDQKRQQVVSKGLGDGQITVIYSAPQGSEIGQLGVLKDVALVLVYNQTERLSKQLLAVDLVSRTSRVLAEGNFDHGQPPQLVDEKTILLLHIVNVDGHVDGHWRRNVARVGLDDSGIHDIFTLPNGGFFRISPDGDTILVIGDGGQPYVGNLSSLGLREINTKGLPDGFSNTGSLCYVNEEYILLWRQKDALAPLGTYLLNVSTGRATRAFNGKLHSMTYLPALPVVDVAEK